jgi:hypothetical protein
MENQPSILVLLLDDPLLLHGIRSGNDERGNIIDLWLNEVALLGSSWTSNDVPVLIDL